MGCGICGKRRKQMEKHEEEYDRLEMLYDEIFELLDGIVRGVIDIEDMHVREVLTEHETMRYATNPQEFEDFGYSENVR